MLTRLYARFRLLFDTKRGLDRHGLPIPHLQVRFTGARDYPYDVTVRRQAKDRFVIEMTGADVRKGLGGARRRVESCVHWLSRCPDRITGISVNMSDGDVASKAGFCWSGVAGGPVLLPDPFFFRTHGFEASRTLSDTMGRPWSQRNARIRWRGGPNGQGRIDCRPQALSDPDTLQRIRFVAASKAIPDFDALIIPLDNKGRGRREFAPEYLGERIPEPEWINDRFAIDTDGQTNTWGNLLTRFHYGCCVFKIDSQYGYRQWYYDRIRPWVHYIPVKADMSDLAERVEWARSHPDECEAIAANGRAFARTMTFESETAFAVAAIVATEQPAGRDR